MGKVSANKSNKDRSSQLSHTEEIKHYIGVVSQDFQRRVSAIPEQFGGLHEKLDSHTGIIGRMAADVEIIKENLEFSKATSRKR